MPFLEITEPALKILNSQRPSKTTTKILIGIIKLLKKYFGAEILLRAPDGLSSELFRAINVAHKLQSLGIIKNISERHRVFFDEPPIYGFYALSDAGSILAKGQDLLSEQKAFWKTIGEATERHLWRNHDWFSKKQKTCRYKDIKLCALDIFSLAGFSEQQKKTCGALQFDENTIFGWVPGRSFISKKKIFCPIQLVSAFYSSKNTKRLRDEKGAEPMLRWCITTGLAISQSFEEAATKSVLEIIERDAFMITYLNKLSPPVVNLDHIAGQDAELAKIIKNFKRYNLEIYGINLLTDFPVYACAVVIIDRSNVGSAFNIGLSANFNFKTAFLSALSEASMARHNPFTRINKTADIDPRKVNRDERMIYWSKIENLTKIEFLTRGEKIKIDLNLNSCPAENNKNYYKEKLNFLIKELKNKNCEAVWVDITNKEARRLGLCCINVIIPELQPLHLHETLPYFGGKRLREIPLKFGYQPAETLNQEPHPFP